MNREQNNEAQSIINQWERILKWQGILYKSKKKKK